MEHFGFDAQWRRCGLLRMRAYLSCVAVLCAVSGFSDFSGIIGPAADGRLLGCLECWLATQCDFYEVLIHSEKKCAFCDRV